MSGLPLIGRILFAGVFLPSGIGHFLNASGMAQYAASKGVPSPLAMVVLTGVMLVLGSLSVLSGYKARIGAWVLVAFLVPTTFIMHNFWGVTDVAARQMEMAQFLKNISLLGASLIVAHFGSGPYSLDAWRPKSAEKVEEVEAKAA